MPSPTAGDVLNPVPLWPQSRKNPSGPARAEERPLVGRRQPVLAGVRGPERALDEPRHPANDPLRGSIAERDRRRAGLAVRVAAHLVVVLEPDQHELRALGPEVHLVRDVDDDRDRPRDGRGHAEVARVVAPHRQRQIQAGQRADAPGPATGRVDHDGCVDRAGGRDDAADTAALDRDPGDRRTLHEARPAVSGRPHERAGGHGRVRVPRPGLPRGYLVVADREAGRELADRRGIDDVAVDAEFPMAGDVGAHAVGRVAVLDPQEAGPREAAVTADPRLPVAEPLDRDRGDPGLRQQVVVDPDEARRATRGTGADRAPLHDGHAGATRREVEGEAGALDAPADDDDVRRVGHARAPARSGPRGQYRAGGRLLGGRFPGGGVDERRRLAA